MLLFKVSYTSVNISYKDISKVVSLLFSKCSKLTEWVLRHIRLLPSRQARSVGKILMVHEILRSYLIFCSHYRYKSVYVRLSNVRLISTLSLIVSTWDWMFAGFLRVTNPKKIHEKCVGFVLKEHRYGLAQNTHNIFNIFVTLLSKVDLEINDLSFIWVNR